jgi:RNA polymerase sigma-70 factor (ECF subfamily)
MSAREDGQAVAFRALIARNAPALARLVRHYEASKDAWHDLEQDILLALWRAQESFRGDCSERTWVYRIAHNVAASHVARALRTRRDMDASRTQPDPGRTKAPDDAVADRDEVRRLEHRIRSLDLPNRQLALLALEGCTTAEIAEVTGLTPTNVTTRLSRLRKTLTEPNEASR